MRHSASTLQFWADPANVQGANRTTRRARFETVSGATTDPDSFRGANTPFNALAPFSMTEGASLNLITGLDYRLQRACGRA
jgi:hypothetical protein